MKRLTLLLALCALMLTFSVPASADDINFSGGVTITQTGTAGSPSVNFTFSGMTVSGMSGDSLNGTAVTITPNSSFSFTSIAGSNGYFSPNAGTISIGNATTGTLTGDITFVTITAGAFPGTFAISIGLNNINVVTGTSAALNGWTGTNGGSGVFTFQFNAGGSLNDLLYIGTGVGALGQTGSIETSVSGSVTVPEPASLFLLGSGLLAGGGFVRRKLQR